MEKGGNELKPKILVSKCIEFDHCRFNGGIIRSEVVADMISFVNFVPVCPEMEIGLGAPRKALRLVRKEGDNRLIQTETGYDATEDMRDFADSLLDPLENLDGFLLKNRSPSCGTNDVKVYAELDEPNVVDRTAGTFGDCVQDKFPLLPIENEGRLRNFRLRENFFTQIFTHARFRERVKGSASMGNLGKFQARHKFLLMAYDQEKAGQLGRLAANERDKKPSHLIQDYENLLWKALSSSPSYSANINVLQHALGYFSDKLNGEEKSFFLDRIERYREGRIPLSAVLNILRSWIVRFDEEYLKEQVFFQPYPEGLVKITDSGKGRSL